MYCAHILPFIRRHLLRRIMLHHWQLGRRHAVCIFYVQFFSKPIRAVRAAWISLKCVHNFLAEACVPMVSNILFLPSQCSLSNVSFPIFPFQYIYVFPFKYSRSNVLSFPIFSNLPNTFRILPNRLQNLESTSMFRPLCPHHTVTRSPMPIDYTNHNAIRPLIPVNRAASNACSI